MIAKTFLVMLSWNISISKEGSSSKKPGYSFGGISIILCGNLHQIPPVAKASQDLLYQPISIAKDSIECQIRRAIFEEFSTVVILKEQIRVTLPPPTCHLDPNHHIAPTTALAKWTCQAPHHLMPTTSCPPPRLNECTSCLPSLLISCSLHNLSAQPLLSPATTIIKCLVCIPILPYSHTHSALLTQPALHQTSSPSQHTATVWLWPAEPSASNPRPNSRSLPHLVPYHKSWPHSTAPGTTQIYLPCWLLNTTCWDSWYDPLSMCCCQWTWDDGNVAF